MFFWKQTNKESLESLETRRNELSSLLISVSGDAYKEEVIQPIEQAIDELSKAYDCKSLEELAFNRGKYEAYREILNIHEAIEMLIKNIDYEMEILK